MSISERARADFQRLFAPDLDAVAGFLANHGLPEDVFPEAVLRQWAATRGFVDVSTRSASTSASNDPGPEDEIRVFDCCGELGYSIPWAQWKTREVPIVPTRSTKRRFVYLWGPASAPPETFRDEYPNCVATLGVAGYSNPDGSVEWGSVANVLSNYARAFLSGPPQGSGRHAKPEAATTEAKLPDAVAGCLSADDVDSLEQVERKLTGNTTTTSTTTTAPPMTQQQLADKLRTKGFAMFPRDWKPAQFREDDERLDAKSYSTEFFAISPRPVIQPPIDVRPVTSDRFFLDFVRQVGNASKFYEYADGEIASLSVAVRNIQEPHDRRYVTLLKWLSARRLRDFLFPVADVSAFSSRSTEWQSRIVWSTDFQQWVSADGFEFHVGADR